MELRELIRQADNVVFFGGAGVSTESGIPDFRSQDGLYNAKYKFPPERILSHSFFMERTADFFEFYKEKMLCLTAKPNAAHVKLAELERVGKLRAVITQNIDGLHQLAGSVNVLELHGSYRRNYCMQCRQKFGVEAVVAAKGVPVCACGGIIKPDVVLYEERLNDDVMQTAAKFIADADVLIVGGTSLAVYPAAGLVGYYSGDKLVLINKGATPLDEVANYVCRDSIGEVLSGAW